MDFTPTREQREAAGLAAEIFGDRSTPERLTALGTDADTDLWRTLCRAGLPGSVTETGLLGLVLLLEEAGRTTAQVPLAATCAYGVLAVAAHGSPEQRARLLPELTDGGLVATGAFGNGEPPGVRATGEAGSGGFGDGEPSAGRGSGESGPGAFGVGEPSAVPPGEGPGVRVGVVPPGEGPAVRVGVVGPAVRAGAVPPGEVPAGPPAGPPAVPPAGPPAVPSGGPSGPTARLTGTVPVVPWLTCADVVLVPDAARELWLLRTDAPGVVVTPVATTAPWSAGRLDLTGAPAERLGGAPGPVGPGPYADVLACARTAYAGLQAGVCAGALARAVAHTAERQQFGKPLDAHQAVLLRAADAYLDTEAIRVTAYEAAWRRDTGRAAAPHALTAAWWAAEAGTRVVHAVQHLHGGLGADLGHPVHRHFLWGRHLAADLGAGAQLLEELGELIVYDDEEGAA
ncbi:acyl-CoA dehydrogenase family protein [Streptomyces sp. BBFR2]|uniref:acyl-CoA dehydrogenase family protein n=1 Tax=Streptomyces sp. BBFR2 TaxID=3372854 RepID=UPI0037DA40C9